MKVTAKARRSGGWWAVEVTDVPGAFSQARRLDQVAEVAAGAVADLLEVPADSIEVTVDADLDDDVRRAVLLALAASREATAAQEAASTLMRAAVATLRHDEHLTARDAAALLEISHQRVAQLEKA